MYSFNKGHVLPIKLSVNYSTSNTAKDDIQVLDEEIKSEINYERNIKINDELFINASHELKTPLNIIYSAAQLIELYQQIGDTNTDKISSSVNSIIQNSLRLMKVINNILDLNKIESGLFNLNYNYINIVEVVEDVVQTVSKTIKSKNLNFIFDTNAEEKYIMVDTEKIQRVLLNVLSNAVKFSNYGGDIFINVTVKDSSVELSIIDKGIGIEKRYLDNIFNRFGQVDKSLSRKAEGSGIGLKLSKAIIEAHGGSINVFSMYNKGSTFIIKLPSKNDTVYTLYSKKIINYDSLTEMIRTEFSDIDDGSIN